MFLSLSGSCSDEAASAGHLVAWVPLRLTFPLWLEVRLCYLRFSPFDLGPQPLVYSGSAVILKEDETKDVLSPPPHAGLFAFGL